MKKINVDSAQLATQDSKTKNLKTDRVKDYFSKVYEESINGKEQNRYKYESNNGSAFKRSNVDNKSTKVSESTEISESDDELKDERVNVIGDTIYIYEQINLNSLGFGKLIQDESLSITGDTSELSLANTSNAIQVEGDSFLTVVTNLKENDTVLSQKNVQEINNSLYKLMESTPDGQLGVMHVQLDPAELGSVDMTLKMEDGMWMAKIQVDNDQVKQLVANKFSQNIENVHVDVDVKPILEKKTISKSDLLEKDLGKLDSVIMSNKSPVEELSAEKLINTTEPVEGQDEGILALEKQVVNMNVRQFVSNKLSSIVTAKDVVLPEENLQKVNDTIVKLMETTTQGNTSVMKVRLYPEELGSVDVMIKIEDGKLIAKILVDNEQVKQLFVNKMGELNDNLVKQNISFEKLQIDVNSSDNFKEKSNHNKGNNSNNNQGNPFDNEVAETNNTEDTSGRAGNISILA